MAFPSLTRNSLSRAAENCKRAASQIFKQEDLANLPQAAVIIPFVQNPSDARPAILFEQRSTNLRHHGGEVSFPGGFCEPGEDPWTAARREAWEELGWSVRGEDFLGNLGSWHNRKSNVRVQPFLVWDEKLLLSQLQPNPQEVDHFFVASVEDLLDMNRREYRQIYPSWPPVPFFHPDDVHIIWGFTGFVLDALLKELLK